MPRGPNPEGSGIAFRWLCHLGLEHLQICMPTQQFTSWMALFTLISGWYKPWCMHWPGIIMPIKQGRYLQRKNNFIVKMWNWSSKKYVTCSRSRVARHGDWLKTQIVSRSSLFWMILVLPLITDAPGHWAESDPRFCPQFCLTLSGILDCLPSEIAQLLYAYKSYELIESHFKIITLL